MGDHKRRLFIQALDGYASAIGADLWRMEDSRRTTLEDLQDLPEGVLDWQAPGLPNTLGTLLYHIAAVEMDWLFEEVLVQEWAPEITALLPHPMRNEDGHLYPVQGLSLQAHLDRLAITRRCFLESMRGMTVDDYRRMRELPPYDVAPDWVVHHLIQHEDEHRGEIRTILTLFASR